MIFAETTLSLTLTLKLDDIGFHIQVYLTFVLKKQALLNQAKLIISRLNQ